MFQFSKKTQDDAQEVQNLTEEQLLEIAGGYHPNHGSHAKPKHPHHPNHPGKPKHPSHSTSSKHSHK